MGSSDKEIRDAIVDVTRDTYKNNPDALTVNHVRGAVVKRLDLDQDFFKEGSWKDESKRIIKEEIERLENEDGSESEADETAAKVTSPVKAKAAKPAKPAKTTKPAKAKQAKPSKKRTPTEEESEEIEKPKSKRQRQTLKGKRSKSDDFIEDSDVEIEEADSSNEAASKKSKKVVAEDAELSEEDEEMKDVKDKEDSSLTELSELEDEPPKKTKAKAAAKPKGKAATKKKEAATLSPSEEKIKQLREWCTKCGIRKVWGKELKKYDTDKEKIKYLQGLLNDVGMTGRFSNEKAKKIKEERELAEELAAVQEGAAVWGKVSERPKRRSTVKAGAYVEETEKKNTALDDIEFLVDRSDESD